MAQKVKKIAKGKEKRKKKKTKYKGKVEVIKDLKAILFLTQNGGVCI
jgi:hypothetical protein